MKGIKIFGVVIVLAVLYALTGCRKEEIITDRNALLRFSTDTVFFDTIFTTIGSVTQRFKAYNPHSQDIIIKDLSLGGGASSYYRLNVDGDKGNSHKNITIGAKDSIYIFVEVTIDPLGESTPLVVDDSVIFNVNGNQQIIKLVAYGQDVNKFSNEIIGTQTWTNQKPYLIYNNVVVDINAVLSIDAGTKVYLHNNSSLLVYGSLNARGTLNDPILFAGDRFDRNYEKAAGQWGTIYFDSESTGNILEYVVIRNSNAGMQLGYPEDESSPSVELRNCMILNAASIGIYAFNADINAYNTIIADCGNYALLFLYGGDYNFYHCTISNISANYPGVYSDGGYRPRSYPSVLFTNYVDMTELDDNFRRENVTYTDEMSIKFYNSIIYGVKDEEIKYDTIVSKSFDYVFDHCLVKNHKDSLDFDDTGHFISIILNKDPLLVNDSISLGEYNFQLGSLSPAINAGKLETILGIPQLQYDFNGEIRNIDGLPDLGAFEYHE